MAGFSARFVVFGVVAIVALATRGQSLSHRQELDNVRSAIRNRLADAELMDGDVIFRRTHGLRGRLATASDFAADYSHTGLISLQGDKRTVIHADPEGKGAGHGRVIRTTLDDYVGDSTVVSIAVYRLKVRDDARIRQAMRWAAGQASKGTPFDGEFTLSDSSAIYCTELVWRAFRVAGLEIGIPSMREPHSLFLFDSLLKLSSIQRSPLLHQVFVSPQR